MNNSIRERESIYWIPRKFIAKCQSSSSSMHLNARSVWSNGGVLRIACAINCHNSAYRTRSRVSLRLLVATPKLGLLTWGPADRCPFAPMPSFCHSFALHSSCVLLAFPLHSLYILLELRSPLPHMTTTISWSSLLQSSRQQSGLIGPRLSVEHRTLTRFTN